MMKFLKDTAANTELMIVIAIALIVSNIPGSPFF